MEVARQAFEQNLEQRIQFYGPEHPKVALAHFNLGDVLIELERYDEALVQHERALAINRKLYPADHLDLADSYDSLGAIWREKGQPQRAIGLHSQALAIRTKQLGADNPLLAYSLVLLGQAQHRADRFARAEASLTRALALLEDGQPDEGLQAKARFSLAQVRLARGDAEQACHLAREAGRGFDGLGRSAERKLVEVRAWLHRCGPVDPIQDR